MLPAFDRFRFSAALMLLLASLPAGAQTLKIGIGTDPETLDPALVRTFDGGAILEAMCDRLFEVKPDNEIVPDLADAYSWSEDHKQLTLTLRQGLKFPDGEPFDAAAVKFTLERDISFPGSIRKSGLQPIEGIDIIDARTIRLGLKAPFPPLMEVLAGLAGIVLPPKGTEAMGSGGVGDHPPCIGPFKVTERVTQDRIVLERTENYWDAKRIKLDHIIYQPLPDGTVRFANLRSGDLDLIEDVQPADFVGLEKDPKLATASTPGLGYQSLLINVGKGPHAETPLGQDARIRKALDLSIDRDAINEVVANGLYIPDNQFMPPQSPFHAADLPVPKRNIAAAKKLLAEAGSPHPSLTLIINPTPLKIQLGQMIQSMAGEAGFDIKLQQTDFTTGLDAARSGNFDAYQVGWGGFIDPDGNSFSLLRSDGVNNYAHYSNPEIDALLDQGRSTPELEARKAIYAKVSTILERDLPFIYLFHPRWLWAFSKSVHGFQPASDGIIRVKDLSKS